MSVSAVIVAAGSSTRMDNGVDKLSAVIEGRTLLAWTISRFEAVSAIDEIILVVRTDSLDYIRDEVVGNEGFKKVKAIVPGGDERQNSTENGLNATSEDAQIVLIHDGARPLVRAEEIDSVIQSAMQNGAALLAVRCKETVKEVMDNKVAKTLPRDTIWLAQTPQGFRKDIILDALKSARDEDFIGTDEASLVERMGVDVSIVEGRSDNLKVTFPEDVNHIQYYLKKELTDA